MTAMIQTRPNGHHNYTKNKPIFKNITFNERKQLVSGVARASLAQWTLIFSLIFGGCCSNVFTLEMVVKEAPKSGNLITLAQFLLVAVEGFIYHLDPKFENGTLRILKKRSIPISRWFIQVFLFFSVSILNNIALGYKISVPVHIVFRSGGLFVSMLMGWLIVKRRYNFEQVSAVALVTLGIILATLANSRTTSHNASDSKEFFIGIIFLTTAMILSCLMGLYQESTYKKYGNHWREGLFYSHFLALPFFAVFHDSIRSQFHLITSSPDVKLVSMLPDWVISLIPPNQLLFSISAPSLLIFLILNMITQYICISGVHRLTSLATSLTLNLILNVRKLVSLGISVVYFGNVIPPGMIIGTFMAFIGTGLYSWGSTKRSTTLSLSLPERNSKLKSK